MSNTNKGGSAFPWTGAGEEGMTLRDYFAAKAMHGILAGDHPITHERNPLTTVAKVSYDQADAMLKAREV